MVKPRGYVSFLEQHHIAVHSLDMKEGMPDPRAVFRLRSIIRDFQPDIVHSHMYHSNILARITRLVCPMPLLICTAHNLKETSRRDGPTWHKELLYRITDALADQTTIICKAGYDRYLRVGAVPRNRLQYIPNGIDMDIFSRSEQRRQRARGALGVGSAFVWLAVGRLVKQKDYPTLFRALALMERKDFIVLIAGSGPLEQELRHDCARLGLDGCVRFCGTREEILDLYNAADAFVMSSKFEGLPLALLEAAALELPAVATDVGGNSEVIVDQETGFLVPHAAPAQLADAIGRLMDAAPEDRRAMGLAARRRCRERYEISVVMDLWLGLYAKSMSAAAEFNHAAAA
jgi:glycosyltransferase involved in cell wall biosynthesis